MNNDRFIEGMWKQYSTLPTEKKTSNIKYREKNSRSRKIENSKIRRKIQKFEGIWTNPFPFPFVRDGDD